MLLVYEIVFSVPVISQIESIGGGCEGGSGSGWESEEGLKQPFRLKHQYFAFVK